MGQASGSSAIPSRLTPEMLANAIDAACESAKKSKRDAVYLVRRQNGAAAPVLIVEKGSAQTVATLDMCRGKGYFPLDCGEPTEDFEVCPSGGSHYFHGDDADVFLVSDGVCFKYARDGEKILNFVRVPVVELLSPGDKAALEMYLSDEKIHPDLAPWMDREGVAELSMSLVTGSLYFRRNGGEVIYGGDPKVPAVLRDFFCNLFETVRGNDDLVAFFRDLMGVLNAR